MTPRALAWREGWREGLGLTSLLSQGNKDSEKPEQDSRHTNTRQTEPKLARFSQIYIALCAHTYAHTHAHAHTHHPARDALAGSDHRHPTLAL